MGAVKNFAVATEEAIQAVKEFRSRKITMAQLAPFLIDLSEKQLELVAEFARIRKATLQVIQQEAKAPVMESSTRTTK